MSKQEGFSQEQYIEICKGYGIEIDPAVLETPDEELSDDELEAVTGGKYQNIDVNTEDYEYCMCYWGGGGCGVNIDGQSFKPCACVIYGLGVETVIRPCSEMQTGEVGHKCECPTGGNGYR